MLAANGWGPFPPAEAFYDGSTYWMWRGNHRRAALLQAAVKAGAGFDLLVPVIVRPGTERDAKLEGLSDNAEHGLRRTVEDKRKAVDWALSDPELSQWSNAKIAAKCRVSAPFVGERREIMQRTAFVASSVGAASTTRQVHRQAWSGKGNEHRRDRCEQPGAGGLVGWFHFRRSIAGLTWSGAGVGPVCQVWPASVGSSSCSRGVWACLRWQAGRGWCY